jgi:hypothetical protein
VWVEDAVQDAASTHSENLILYCLAMDISSFSSSIGNKFISNISVFYLYFHLIRIHPMLFLQKFQVQTVPLDQIRIHEYDEETNSRTE